jgi:sulfotransferase
MNKKIFFLSGLPRTGSTLLTSILTENPDFYHEGNSALCQLMWDTKVSCETNSYEQLLASNKLYIKDKLLKNLPQVYYKNVNSKYIIDKCRSWTLPENLKLIRDNITDSPKIIVMTRPISEIVKSFCYLNKINNKPSREAQLIENGSEPIMRSLSGVTTAMEENSNQFLFVSYNDLITDPQNVINRIYEFLEVEKFDHNLGNILNRYPENEDAYELKHMHDVRNTIEKRTINYRLSKEVLDVCNKIDKLYPYL